MITPLLDIALRASVLLILAAGFMLLTRRAPAAQRHLLHSLVLSAVLVLPALTTLPWQWEVLPNNVSSSARQLVGTSTTPEPEVVATPGAGVVAPRELTSGRADELTSPAVGAFDAVGMDQVLVGLWAVVAMVLLVRIVASLGAAWWLLRGSSEVEDPVWQIGLARAADQLGVLAPVRLLETSRTSIPMTFGLRHPVIVLPIEARDWSADARRIVLLHELAHVRRGDMITNLVGQIACAVYWFHPMVWSAAKRLRIEAEQACDDMVLGAGAAPSAYAEQLLTIVQQAGRGITPAIALPMAQPSAFEGRILAILSRDATRHGLTRRAVLAGVALMLAVSLPLAALAPKTGLANDAAAISEDADVAAQNPAEQSPPAESAPPEPSASTPVGDGPSADEQRPSVSPVVIAGLVSALSDSDVQVRLAAVQALGNYADTAAVNALLNALRRDTSKDVRRAAAWALGEIEDPRAVNGLVAALREERDREVRLAIVHALGEIESVDAVAGLSGAIRGETDAEIRRQMVWALGEIESPDAVPVLSGLLRDDDTETRRMSAWALGEIESPSAVEALSSALGRETAEVIREQIVWALGEIEDMAAAPALEQALRDASLLVRRKAVYALGELDGLRSAPPGLIAALRDADIEVRRGAAYAVGELQDHAAIPALIGLLRDTDLDVRRHAVRALGEMRSVAAAEALVGLLRDEDPEIRRLAAEALGNR